MEHLACFVGGMLALGAQSVPAEDREDWWLPTGAEITRTCYEMYARSPSGLAPEQITFASGEMAPKKNFEQFMLRPETLESLFYMHRLTGNQTYRDWSWRIFKAIDSRTRAPWGFAAAETIGGRGKPVVLEDKQETFM